MGGVAMKRLWFLLFILVAFGCRGNAGLQYDRVHASVVDEWGEVIDAVPSDHCLTLPVLLGSQVRHSFRLDPRLEFMLDADRDGVVVHFEGSTTQRRFRTRDLGDSPARVDVASATGRTYEVKVALGCPADQPGEG